MENNNKKTNIGCMKIFQLLTLLYDDKADYESVLKIFDGDDTTQNNIQVTLNKYINTLKVFGIKVAKEKGKYKLLSNIYSEDVTQEEMSSLALLSEFIGKMQDLTVAKDVQELINAIEIRMNNKDKSTFRNLLRKSKFDFEFFYKDFREQINECERICQEKYITNIIYKKGKKEFKVNCIPKEVIYNSKTANLKIFDNDKKTNTEIPINKILLITQTPLKSNSVEINNTVVFKLKDRLSKIYKLKENEYSNGLDKDGNLIIVNKNEDIEKLISRLMRYADSCEVLTPKYVRDEMLRRIAEALSKYDI